MTWINWHAKAEDAEARGDWDEAKRCWYYAAQDCVGNPHGLRTEYGRREDLAEERRRAQQMTEVTITRRGIKVLVEREVSAILAADKHANKLPGVVRMALASTIATKVAGMLRGIARPTDDAIMTMREQ